jgi:hypothetical protein
MLPNILARNTTAAAAALAVALSLAAPAHATSQKDRAFLKGVAATLLVGALLKGANSPSRAAPAPQQPQYFAPQEPQYYAPRQPVYAPATGAIVTGVHGTPSAQVFNEFSPSARRIIQQRLAAQGYYRGPIDGIWGPGTARAVAAYARDARLDDGLASRNGAIRIYSTLIG